ncbi:hypothetical protein [Hydrogenophaga sp.]|uniref:hypothetical protein n=1 Tax=Hydrogenophaga sp. TaxID=1904254 RepID=UPI00286E0811|nr:hypothetical protein [Hydrogenophaga sp.]
MEVPQEAQKNTVASFVDWQVGQRRCSMRVEMDERFARMYAVLDAGGRSIWSLRSPVHENPLLQSTSDICRPDWAEERGASQGSDDSAQSEKLHGYPTK